MPDRFSSQEVVALIGVTARQLQWWDERGLIKPERQGHRRLYSMENVMAMAVMRFLDREFGKGLAEIVGRNSDVHLLTDGKHLYLETSAKQIVDILKNSDQPILGICLSDAVRQVRADVIAGKASTSVIAPIERRRARKAS